METQAARLLIRRSAAAPLAKSLSAAGNQFNLTPPLFRAPAAGQQWHALETSGQATVQELWDAAYELRERQADIQPDFAVEPDCETLWPTPTGARQRGLFAGGPEADRGRVNVQSPDFPQGPGFAWHLQKEYSQLELARSAIQDPEPVRVAILDVGFDYSHNAMPEHLDRHLEKNFVDDGRKDASDPDQGGFLRNPGHGTATIAILAGKALDGMKAPTPNGLVLGGAPGAHIVPIRVAPSVVLLRTSAFAQAMDYILGLQANPETSVDVVSMSMGGVASDAWADVVNQAYEAGIFVVTAAGNNYGRPKSIVFPARFRRVLAACGIMADLKPYVLGFGKMSGNYGPDSKMDTAIAAFTPNIPWAEIGSRDIVDWDGEGTSSATPQVAAAAALWLQQHKKDVAAWAGWEKVEMIRHALFRSANHTRPESRKYFGQGVIQANRALMIAPSDARRQELRKQAKDSASFALWRALRGTLFAAANTQPSPLDSMFELELAQLIHRDGSVETVAGDPEKGLDKKGLEQFRDAVLGSPYLSRRLRREIEQRSGKSAPPSRSPALAGGRQAYPAPAPASRRLQVFSFDPAAGRSLDQAEVSRSVVSIPWEKLSPGPSGEYIEVIDHDPASGCFYAPVDLEDPHLLAADGLAPAEGNPKFHQQMTYAVAMRTIATFESALGRKALWSARMDGKKDATYVRQLRIYPHALRDRNAYYNPLKKALLFGYFPARPVDPASIEPGGMIFTCLSHDVVAHETSHALLDGMARGLTEPTNPDMLAFHEGFADIVALLQHFSLPGVVEPLIAKVRGDLRDQSLLGVLAEEFGRGYGLHGALRSYIGRIDPRTGKWERLKPSPSDYTSATEQHDRGAVLVAAIFDAFLSIYERRIADLKRIASEGTGILREGEIHPDLVRRFASEARKAAAQMLKICIRAVDYCPPVDLTFGDYLRAAVTADADLFPDDPLNYRVALIEAFRRRGIYPRDVRTMSEDALRWRSLDGGLQAWLSQAGRGIFRHLSEIGEIVRRVSNVQEDVDWPLYDESRRNPKWPPREKPTDQSRRRLRPREAIFKLLRQERGFFKLQGEKLIESLSEARRTALGTALGVDLSDGARQHFEVRALNFSDRSEPNGMTRHDAIIWIQQRRHVTVDGEEIPFEGGCTLIIDLDSEKVRYAVRKSISSLARQRAVAAFRQSGNPLGLTYFAKSPYAGPGHRFAVIHDSDSNQERNV